MCLRVFMGISLPCFLRSRCGVTVALIIEPEEGDECRDTLRPMQVVGDPAGFRSDVMGSNASGGDEFIADLLRQWEIGQLVAMDVPQLVSLHGKGDGSEPPLSLD